MTLLFQTNSVIVFCFFPSAGNDGVTISVGEIHQPPLSDTFFISYTRCFNHQFSPDLQSFPCRTIGAPHRQHVGHECIASPSRAMVSRLIVYRQTHRVPFQRLVEIVVERNVANAHVECQTTWKGWPCVLARFLLGPCQQCQRFRSVGHSHTTHCET